MVHGPASPLSRWLPAGALLALGIVVVQVGLLAPAAHDTSLRVALLQDHLRLRHAVQAYVRDTGALPAPSFDISTGSGSVLTDARLVPFAQQQTWRGPYLQPALARPTPSSFWSLAGAEALPGDGEADAPAAWGRLHRGYGEIDEELAQSLDTILDDGDPDRGEVRVSGTWLWFRLADRPAAR